MKESTKTELTQLVWSRRRAPAGDWSGNDATQLRHVDVRENVCQGKMLLWRINFNKKGVLFSCEGCGVSIKIRFSDFMPET